MVGRSGVRFVAHRGKAPEEVGDRIGRWGFALGEVVERRPVFAPERGVRGFGIDSIRQGPHELYDSGRPRDRCKRLFSR